MIRVRPEGMNRVGPVTDSAARGRVLVVCTGNVCRSPYLEHILRRDLTGTGIAVESAGTGALAGRGMDPGSLDLLTAKGLPGDEFLARQLTESLVREADLVVGAAREHVDAAARLFPRALRYSFSLLDLADLLDGVTDEDLARAPGRTAVARVAAAAVARRGTLQPRRPEDATIVDPFRQGPHVFAEMARQVAEALPPVVSALRRSAGA